MRHLVLLMLLLTPPALAQELLLTLDRPCTVRISEHKRNNWRVVAENTDQVRLKLATYAAVDVQAEASAWFFFRWRGNKAEVVPGNLVNLTTELFLDVPRAAAGTVLVMAAAGFVFWRKLKQTSQKAEQLEEAMTQVELQAGLFPADGSLPTRIDRYNVHERLGAGGMAVVYKVSNDAGDIFAMKVPLPNVLADEEFRHRFEREARLLTRLHHPNLVRILDLCTGAGGEFPYPYYVMEWVIGRPLNHLIRGGEVDVPRALDITDQILAALEVVHGAGVIHRDIKPSNIMVPHQSPIKLMDFGIAGALDMTPLTMTAEALGTAQYMAPEQIEARDTTIRSDLYAVGSMLYEMCVGHAPYPDDNMVRVTVEKSRRDPPPMSTYRDDLPPPLEQYVAWLMQRNPLDRPDTATLARMEMATMRRHLGW